MEQNKGGIRSQIEEIIYLCNDIQRSDINNYWFRDGATEDGINSWEDMHQIMIPESYKEWLRFSNGANICSPVALLFPIKNISVSEKFLPEDLVWIGEIIGDGELICFSKNTGKFVRYFEGARKETENFGEILQSIIKILKDDVCIPDTEYIFEKSKALGELIEQNSGKAQTIVKEIIEKPGREKNFIFNSLNPKQRQIFFMMITPQEQKTFIEDIRHQATLDFWANERLLFRKGQATRDWTAEQMEEIYNIGVSTGREQMDAKAPHNRISTRNTVFGAEMFYARRMVDINSQPQYAGEYRGLQALRYREFYNGITGEN